MRNGRYKTKDAVCWYLNGELHREDGPAIEISKDIKFWCLEGIEYSEQKFNAIQLQKKLNSELPEKQFDSKKNKI